MKILYSQIKELVPGLTLPAKEVGDILTMTGFMMDAFQELQYRGQTDYLLGLEVRQNRADCLSVLGIAKEVAAYCHLPLVLPKRHAWQPGARALSIKVESAEVKRVAAVTLEGVKNGPSPAWLVEFLSFYDINSVNLLVDLSNYAMIYTGYACHLLDADKMSGLLRWSVNDQAQTIETLDGSQLELKGGELIISDDKQVLALAGLVGCRSAAITETSCNLVAEMAVYDRFIIKQNSRSLGVVTEASNRLSKDMSPLVLEQAFDFLIALILEHAGGQVVSALAEHYPTPQTKTVIEFDPTWPERFAGIVISVERVKEILTDLGFAIEIRDETNWLVTPPAERLDLSLAEDLVEEVLRFVRYDNIPSDDLPALMVVPDITPAAWRFKEKLRDFLVARSFDEILSQPLVSEAANAQANAEDWQPVLTQNSVNEEFPALRQSILTGLVNQLDLYAKKNLLPARLFEIGRVFGRIDSQVVEREALGLVLQLPKGQSSLAIAQAEAENLLGAIGLVAYAWVSVERHPELANPHSSWELKQSDLRLGRLFKCKPLWPEYDTYALVLDVAACLSATKAGLAVVELEGKLIQLDANVELADAQALKSYLIELQRQAGDKLWSIEAIDEYALSSGSRYTVRATYVSLNDTEAKALHAQLFKL